MTIDAETYRRLLAIVRKYAGDDAEDILQDAVYTSLVHQVVDVERYILASARKIYCSRMNRKVNTEEVDSLADTSVQECANIIDELPEGEGRRIAQLRLQGYKYREIAEIMGVSINRCLKEFYKMAVKFRKDEEGKR